MAQLLLLQSEHNMIESKFERTSVLPVVINDIPTSILIPDSLGSHFQLTIGSYGEILAWPVSAQYDHDFKQDLERGIHYSETIVPTIVATLTDRKVPNWESQVFNINMHYIKSHPLTINLAPDLIDCSISLPIPIRPVGPEKGGFYYCTDKLMVRHFDKPDDRSPTHIKIRWDTLVELGLLFNYREDVERHQKAIVEATL